jgi:lipopolysaccharide export LptBFGC system permease protein LptF
MPEGPEVETEKLHEAIHEELEREGGGFLRVIALTTAFLAALAALSSLRAGATVNEALVLKTEATRLQSEASDQWAYYQAKGVKAAVAEASRAAFEAAGEEPPASYAEKQRRYGEEQAEIQEKAKEKERERDEKEKEAKHLLHLHHRYAEAVALFQVSIALGAVAALTRNRLVWLGSMAVGAGGLAFFALALLG